MQSTASTHSATDSARSHAPTDSNRNDSLHGDEKKGFVYLLDTLSREEILAEIAQHFNESQSIHSFLYDGVVPSAQSELNVLANIMLRQQQTSVLNALLNIAPLEVNIYNQSTASALLGLAHSGGHLFNLAIKVVVSRENSEIVIPLLRKAFAANRSLNTIALWAADYRLNGVLPLFELLSSVKNLQLTTKSGRLAIDDVLVLADLVSKNKNIRTLELKNLCAEYSGEQRTTVLTEAVIGLYKQLEGQLQLERLVLMNVPQECQATLGNLLGATYALTELQFELEASGATKALIAGLRKNISIESLTLDLTNIEDDMLPLLAVIAQSGSPVRTLGLRTLNGRTDLSDSQHIGNLIANNGHLASLTWGFPTSNDVNLAIFGAALEKNNTLDSLVLVRQDDNEGLDAYSVDSIDWVDASTIPLLIDRLKNNRTLTTLVFNNAGNRNFLPGEYPKLQQVLDRNLAWRNFACSDEFISGATEGFFSSMGLPIDTSNATAQFLLKQAPRISSGALALVNKKSYCAALSARRNALSASLDQHLIEHSNSKDQDDFMIRLLNGIVSATEDFSADDLVRIANHPSLGAGLVTMMQRSEPNYLLLTERFCLAVGTDLMRLKITNASSGSLDNLDREIDLVESEDASFDSDEFFFAADEPSSH